MQLKVFHSLTYNKENLLGLSKNLKLLKNLGFNAVIAEVGTSVKLASHPEICDGDFDISDLVALSKECKKLKIELIPLFNCLGHQGWQKNKNGLIKAYPQFEEIVDGKCDLADVFLNYTPAWCPSSDVLTVLKDVIKEIITKTKCKYFHTGMDEVFKIGLCQKCKKQAKSELFIKTANALNDIITKSGCKMMMWADRLIPNTVAKHDWAGDALNINEGLPKLNKDIILCDWQYRGGEYNKTNDYLLSKGFSIIPSVCDDSFTAFKTIERCKTLNIKYKGQLIGVMLTNWGLSQKQIENILNNKEPQTDEEFLLKSSFNVFEYFDKK